jgi:molybdopterin/thiamine biosynthesis adenylyltransferase
MKNGGGKMDRFLRNKDIISQKNLNEVTVIGAGGVGSCLILSAAIMGFKKIHLWDFDTLEEHNLSTTMYPESFLGETKTHAAKELVRYFGCKTEIVEHQKWGPMDPLTPCVMMAPDNMEIRKIVYMAWMRSNKRKVLVDGRMGALTMEVITCDYWNDNYLTTWKSSSEIEDEPCTAKHTIFTANIIAGIMLSQIFNVLHKRSYHSYIWKSLAPYMSREQGLVIPENMEKTSDKETETQTSVSESESTSVIRST